MHAASRQARLSRVVSLDEINREKMVAFISIGLPNSVIRTVKCR